MLNKSICVEFFGIWGSGKTTLINSLSQQFQKEGLIVATLSDFSKNKKIKRYCLIMIFLIKNPVYFIKYIGFVLKFLYILRPKNKLEIDLYKTLIKTHIIKNIILYDKNPDILLWEGVYHLLPMFTRMSKLNNQDVVDSAHTIYCCQSNYAVFIDINTSLSMERVEKDHENGNHRFNPSDLSRLNFLYSNMVSNQNIMQGMLKLAEIPVLIVNGESPLAKKTNKIVNFIQKL